MMVLIFYDKEEGSVVIFIFKIESSLKRGWLHIPSPWVKYYGTTTFDKIVYNIGTKIKLMESSHEFEVD